MDCTEPFAESWLETGRSKWKWFRNEIEFCSFQMNQEGVYMLDSKMQAVTEWHRPQNMKEVSGFLGLMGYYC